MENCNPRDGGWRWIGWMVVLAGLIGWPGWPGACAADRHSLSGQGYEVIPLRRTADNRLYVSGRLEGRRASFLVDTGWSETTVSRAGEPGHVMLRDIQLGRVVFTNQPAMQDQVSMGGKRASFDAVLGLDFLRRQQAVIDCGANRLFTRRTAATAEAADSLANTLRAAGYEAVSLTVHDDVVVTGAATLGEHAFQMLVDSGAAWTCLDWAQAESWGLKATPSTTRLSGEGSTGNRALPVARISGLRLGGVNLRVANVGLLELKDWGLARAGTPSAQIKGLLGGEVLAAHRALIDCGALKLWLQPARRR